MSSRGIELRWSVAMGSLVLLLVLAAVGCTDATKTAKPVESLAILDEGNNAGGGGTGASGGASPPDLP